MICTLHKEDVAKDLKLMFMQPRIYLKAQKVMSTVSFLDESNRGIFLKAVHGGSNGKLNS